MSESPIAHDAPVNDDDVLAGKLLGGVLSLFFMYTVITTFGVMWWTWKSING
ncbi:MAG: hypothetical protein JKY95_13970 [Planctomycetaceae bacterium]|nr:hypothetical protein [Planctomycetaceae bacterium]